MNDDMKMILFSDLHYLDDNHKEKTNRKLTKLAIPVIEKLIYEINQKIKPDICVNLGDLIEDTEDYKQDIMNYDFAYTKLPILMFCHYGIAEDNMNGNWWFSKDSERALLKNRKQIKEIIKKHNVLAIFSGHQHWTKKINEDNLDYYIIGSLTEDINNNGIPDAVYYVVSLNDDNIDVKEQHIKL